MNEPVIDVERLGKRYTLGETVPSFGARTFRDAIAEAFNRMLSRSPAVSPVRPNHIWALRDVSFTVGEGEILGIIGRNGAGKSTLLKLLARITRPTEGRIRIGASVASLLEVGTGFSAELTGRENIYVNGAILGMRRAEIQRHFDSIVDFAEVSEFLDTPVKRYSMGMYLRLAFSVAAHLQPDILLVDEVLAVGDASFQRRCMEKMTEITRSGKTILFVSHNMVSIRSLCTTGILLDRGSITASGSIDDVIARYLTQGEEHPDAVSDLPPAGTASPGTGLRLTIADASGDARCEFMIGQVWKAILEFETFQPLNNFIAALGLTTVEGSPVTTYWSAPADLDPGRYVVEYPCDLQLAHGLYTFIVGLSADAHTFYYAKQSGQIRIGELAEGEQPYKAVGCGVLTNTVRPRIVPAGIRTDRRQA